MFGIVTRLLARLKTERTFAPVSARQTGAAESICAKEEEQDVHWKFARGYTVGALSASFIAREEANRALRKYKTGERVD